MAWLCLIILEQSMPYTYFWFTFEFFCFWNRWIHEFEQRYPVEKVWVIFQLSKWGYRFLNWVYESYITFDCVFGQRTTWRNSFDQVETVIRTREKWKIQFETDDKSNLSLCFNWRATIICLLLRQTWRNKSSEGKHMHTSTYFTVHSTISTLHMPNISDSWSWDWSTAYF